MRNASKILWDYFVAKHPSTTTSTTVTTQAPKQNGACDGSEHTLPHFKLDKVVTSSVPTSHLKHFIYSILITTHLSLKEGGLLTDQLSFHSQSDDDNVISNCASLRNNHFRRLRLVQRLLVALEVAGMLNDAGLCLQVVVQMCGLLAPLLQHRLSSKPLLGILLHCHAVLMELPESLLLHGSKAVTCALHHVIAVTMYHVCKVIAWMGYGLT